MPSNHKRKFKETEIGMIPEDWEMMNLQQAGVKLLDCVHNTPPSDNEGYAYIAIPQLKNGRIEFSEARKISYENYIIWTKKTKPQAYDVVLSRRCNPGETAVVPGNVEFALGQNLVILRSDGGSIFPPFLRWLARSPDWWEQIKTFINVGAIFDSLKCADIPNFTLPIPPIDEQKSIAEILSSFDEKIELNQQMNRTLEQIGKAIFKHWFVDFEFPDEKSRPYKSSGGEMVDSELGEIPKGWEIVSFGEIVEVRGGSTPRTDVLSYWGGNIPWITPKELTNSDRIHFSKTERYITDEGLKRIARDLLPVGSILLTSRAPIGCVGINDVPMVTNQGFINIVCSDRINNMFLTHWLKSNMEYLKSYANGTTFLELSKSSFKKIKLALPSKPMLDIFEKLASCLDNMMNKNHEEIDLLSGVRDSLLPKLMSGKIRVGTMQ